MHKALGIDLGTTNSVTAIIRKGNPVVLFNLDAEDFTPSVVALKKNGELLIGRKAKGRLNLPTSPIYSAKRFMGRRFDDELVQKALKKGQYPYKISRAPDGGVLLRLGSRDYTPAEIGSLVLRRLKEGAESAQHGETYTRAVITVPAYFGEAQVAATREAAEMAGLQVLRIINEPTAAALAFGLNRDLDKGDVTVLVYDLGGGTFDISILMLVQGIPTVLGTEGDNLLGGDDFDDLLVAHFIAEVRRVHGLDVSQNLEALTQLRQCAEAAKIVLSTETSTDIDVDLRGTDGVVLEMELERSDFEAMIRKQVDGTIRLTEKALADAHLKTDDIDYVLLVGGSTAIPLVQKSLQALFGAAKIRRDVNPMQCVALGAAVQTALIPELACPKCHSSQPVAELNCRNAACGAPLGGSSRLQCTACHLWSESTATACAKCGTPLSGTAPPPKPREGPLPTGSDPADAGGLACPVCGVVNDPGATICSACGADMAMTSPLDITPKPLGIELHDGRFAVILDKGISYPTRDTQPRLFYTTDNNQPRLDVAVYEGFHDTAADNELCGMLSVSLPKGSPRNTPVSVALGLDENRIITVSVSVGTQGLPKSVTLQRHRFAAHEFDLITQARDALAKFLDTWDKELTANERSDLLGHLERLDGVIGGEPPGQAGGVDRIVAEAAECKRLAFEIRGSDALLGNTLVSIERYLDAEERDRLLSIKTQLRDARERGDWVAGAKLYPEADQAVFNLPAFISIIARYKTAISLNHLSPALATELGQVLDMLELAIDIPSDPKAAAERTRKVEQGTAALQALAPRVDAEIEARQPIGPSSVKPQDRRS